MNPPLIPHLEQYFGAWAMHLPVFRACAERIRNMDLAAHVARVQAALADAEADDEPGLKPYEVNEDGVAFIGIRGALTKYGSSLSDAPGMVGLRRAVRQARQDEDVRALTLVIDSPGGSVYGLDDLAAEVAAFAAEKPVLAYLEDLAASAAYYIASQATTIVANPSAEVGSIGTYAVVEDWSAFYAQHGVKVHVISTAPLKGAGLEGSEITPPQLAEWQRQINDFGDLFIDSVARGRRLPREQVQQLATGQVWIAREAQRLGLVDSVGTLDSALERLVADLLDAADTAAEVAAMANDANSVQTAAPATPAAATLLELEAALPGADEKFLVAQLRKGATLEAARTDWMAAQAAEIKRLTDEAAQARKQPAPATTVSDSTLVTFDAHGITGSGDPETEWERNAPNKDGVPLQDEFGGSKAAYLAFVKAEADNRIRRAKR